MDIDTLYDGVLELLGTTLDAFEESEEGTVAYHFFQGQVELLEIIKDAVEVGTF